MEMFLAAGAFVLLIALLGAFAAMLDREAGNEDALEPLPRGVADSCRHDIIATDAGPMDSDWSRYPISGHVVVPTINPANGLPMLDEHVDVEGWRFRFMRSHRSGPCEATIPAHGRPEFRSM